MSNYVDRTAGDERKMWFNGFEYNFSARLPKRGITIFGGGMSEKTIAQVCDEKANPNLLLYCDQTQSGIPFRTQFKIAGNVPIEWGIQVGYLVPELCRATATARARCRAARAGRPGQRVSRRPHSSTRRTASARYG